MNIPRKAWVHKSGAIAPIPEPDFGPPEDHGVFAAQNPEKFGMSHEEFKAAVGNDAEYTRMRNNERAESYHVNKALNDLGWMRSWRSTTHHEDGSKTHSIIISSDTNNAHPHDFIEPLRTFKPALESLPKNHSFGISLNGFDTGKTHRDDHLRQSNLPVPQQDQVALGDLNTVNKYIGETGGKRSRDPQPQAAVPTSTDIRAAIGPKPESMPMAQYNLMRTIGDSYEPCRFNVLLEKIGNSKKSLNESGGKRILGVNPLQMTTNGLRRHLEQYSNHLNIETKGKHLKIRSSSGELIHTLTQGDIGPKTAIYALTRVRDHLIKVGGYTPEKNESRGNIARRPNRMVGEPSEASGPSIDELKDKQNRLKSIVLSRLGEKRRNRVQQSLARTEAKIAQASSN